MYQIIFAVRCETCGQTLEPTASSEGVSYEHGNAEDCSEQGVILPFVSVEDFTKILNLNSPAPAKPKTAPKAASKKKVK